MKENRECERMKIVNEKLKERITELEMTEKEYEVYINIYYIYCFYYLYMYRI